MQPFPRPGDDDTCTNDAEGDGPLEPHPPLGHGGSLIDRRGLLRGAAGLIPVTAGMAGLGWAVAPSEAEAASGSPPYPFAKRRVTRMDGNFLWKKGQGADQWVSGEIGGGRILAAWGDGFGFNPSGKKGFIGVTEISGSVSSPRGADLWRNSSAPLKPCAMIANNGTPLMYAVSDRDNRDGTLLLRGSNGGRSWSSPSSPVLSRSRNGLVVVGSVDRAPGYVSSDVWLYLAAHGNLKGAALYSKRNNPRIYLAFLDRNRAASAGSWQWYAGYRNGNPYDKIVTDAAPWESAGKRPKPVPAFSDSAGAGKHFLTSWCPTTGYYVAVKTHEKNGLGIFTSPTPWGPWNTAWYGNLITTAGEIFTAKAISMWSIHGTIAIMWSGGPSTSKNSDYDAVFMTRFRYG